MGWQFRKRIQIAPGVKINFSKRGISTTIGTRGASMTFGKNGTYVNTGIPGTGLYQRTKISTGNSSKSLENAVKQNTGSTHSDDLRCAIMCGFGLALVLAFIIWLICEDFFIVSFLICILLFSIIIAVFFSTKTSSKYSKEDPKMSIESEIAKVNQAIPCVNQEKDPLKLQILNSYKFCLSHVNEIDDLERVIVELEKDAKVDSAIIQEKKEELTKLQSDFESNQFDGDNFQCEKAKETYERFVTAFDNVAGCSKKRYVAHNIEHIRDLLGSASVLLQRGIFDYIKSDYETPIIEIQNVKLYFYPRFIIRSLATTSFEIIPWNEFSIKEKPIISYWTSEKECPNDAEKLETHFLYERKDGGPDLRYTDNPLMYHVRIGEVYIEGFPYIYFSNHQLAEAFVDRLQNFKQTLMLPEKKKKKATNKKEDDKIIVETKAEINLQAKHDMASKRNPLVKDGTLNMKKEDLAKFQRAINRIGYFYDKYCHIDEFYGYIRPSIADIELYGPAMCMADIITCIESLGAKADVSENLGIPLFLAAHRLMTHEVLQTDYLYRVDEDICKSIQTNFIENSINLRDSATGLDLFFISTFFRDWQDDKKDKYLELLHDFASLVVEYLGDITQEKKEFLESILNHQGTSPNKETMPDSQQKNDTIIEDAKDNTEQENAIDQLSKLIGLNSVKQDIKTLSNFIKIQQKRSEQGLKSSSISYHCVFTGNPGTGKTTVARIVANIYKEMGILKRGHLVETDRSGLVAEYVGQTAVKTNKIIDSALDGVLFIDEAYTLVQGDSNDFGREAIATLLKRMEDDRERLVVILAGYSKPMEKFINANPGLQSRFNRYIDFPDYTEDELYQIFQSMLKSSDYILSKDADDEVLTFIHKAVSTKDDKFGNARFVRNMFEKAIEHQANRLAEAEEVSADELTTIKEKDIPV